MDNDAHGSFSFFSFSSDWFVHLNAYRNHIHDGERR